MLILVSETICSLVEAASVAKTAPIDFGSISALVKPKTVKADIHNLPT